MTKVDDLEAVRILAETQQPFTSDDRERIIRWAREKLGMTGSVAPAVPQRIDVGGDSVKATAQTWFENHRPSLATLQADSSFKAADQAFASLLEWADQNTTRAKYRDLLQTTKAATPELGVSGGRKFDTCGGRKSDSRQHGLAAG